MIRLRRVALPLAWSLAMLGTLLLAATLIVVMKGGAPGVSAASHDPLLAIAPGAGGPWGSSTEADWVLLDGQPGSSIAGAVQLRLAGTPPAGSALLLEASANGPGLLSGALITAMSLDAVDLLPAWSDCASGGLSVHDVMVCTDRPGLPLPVAGGSWFAMEVTIDPDLGNSGQGAAANLTLTFSLGTGGAPSQGSEPTQDVGPEPIPEVEAPPAPAPAPAPFPTPQPPLAEPDPPPLPSDAPSGNGSGIAPDDRAGAPSPGATGDGWRPAVAPGGPSLSLLVGVLLLGLAALLRALARAGRS